METISVYYESIKVGQIDEKLLSMHHNEYECVKTFLFDEVALSKLLHIEAGFVQWQKLKGSEVDKLFYSLRYIKDKQLLDKIFYVIKNRVGKRHSKVIWVLLQYDWNNPVLLSAGRFVLSYTKENYRKEYDETLLKNLEAENETLLESVLKMLHSYEGSIDSFVEHWDICKATPFYIELCIKYLSSCEEEGLVNNVLTFSEFISNMSFERCSEMVTNYFERLSVDALSEAICVLLYEKFGKVNNKKWEIISEEAKSKFLKWLDLREMMSFFGKSSRRWDFWSRREGAFKNVIVEQEHSSLYIYTDRYVIFAGHVHDYLIRKKVFNILYEKYLLLKEKDNETTFPSVVKNYITAREALLEGRISDVYEINYEGAGMLYIRELIEMGVADEYEVFD